MNDTERTEDDSAKPAPSATTTTHVESKDGILEKPLSELPAPADPPLSTQQSLILERILNGENFFFTGSAGTGKSVLLRAIIKAFRERKEKNAPEKQKNEYDVEQAYLRRPADMEEVEKESERWLLGITASTGMAAV